MEKPRVMGVGFGVMLIRDGKMVLGKRHVDPEKASSLLGGAGSWTFPGGKLDFGETFEDAVAREVLEETGLQIHSRRLQLISVSNDIVANAHFVTLGFLHELEEGEPEVREPDEITMWDWFPIANPPSPLFVATERILQNFSKGSVYSSSSD
jgi:8-oxo-dGTP diphosphatase